MPPTTGLSPLDLSSQSTPTPPFPHSHTDQLSPALLAPFPAPSPASQSTNPATSSTTGIGYNPPHVPPGMTFSSVPSHSVIHQAGRDIHIYPPINGTSIYFLFIFDRFIYYQCYIAALTTNREQQVSYQPMPCHNKLFTGRQRYLETLRQYFGLRGDSHPRRSFLIYGMGGAGKTGLLARAQRSASGNLLFWRQFM
jgi:hypothetical protein